MNTKLMNLFVLLVALSYFAIETESCHSSQTSASEDKTQDVLSKDDLALYRSIKKFRKQQRAKRSVNQYYLELLIVVDRSMVDFHGDDLEPYLTSIMAGVQHRFKYALIDGSIQFQVTDVLKLHNSSEANIDYTNGTSVLSSFCAWKQRAVVAQHGAQQHDVALFMTRAPIAEEVNQKSICQDNSCLAVRDMGLGSVNIITHEMGHILGAVHDETPFCKYFADSAKYIMSNSSKAEKLWWKWSECSSISMTDRTLRNITHNKCLTLNPDGKYLKLQADHRFMGQHYSLDKQCELVNRSTPYACAFRPCEHLRCKQFDNSSSYCFPEKALWADGTECGAGKWCENGQCVQADHEVIQRMKESGWTHAGAFDLKIATKTRVTTPIVIILSTCLLVTVAIAIIGVFIRMKRNSNSP